MTNLLTISDFPYKIQATIHPCDQPISTILYLHGGGMIFGHRDDLPQDYITLLQTHYRIVTIDYLLAPEVPFETIITTLQQTIEQIIDFLDICDNFCLFGRSAGAYLALLMAKHLSTSPRAIVSFYGYYNVNLHNLLAPSQYYLNMPQVSNALPISPNPCYKTVDTYMPQYIYARQQGTWAQLLQLDIYDTRWQLSPEDCQYLPPTFLTAAINDPDVSYLFSSTLSQLIPTTCFVPLFHNVHDFDRDTTVGFPVYQKMMTWIEEIL